MNKKNYLFLLIPFLFFIACDEADDDSRGDEMARLEAWLKVHNINVQPTSSGLYYINKQEGTGLSPIDSSYIIFSYTARTLEGDAFETTVKDTAKFNDLFSYTTHYTPSYQAYIFSAFKLSGLFEGLSYMKEGGKARLIIPSSLGYGSTGSGSIKGYTTVIYDVELIKVVKDPVAYEKSLIADYLEKNPGFTSISDSIYIKRIDDDTPTRKCIIANDSIVYVNYTGRYLDGYVFDTNIESVARKCNIYSSSKTYSEFTFTVGSSNQIAGYSIAVKHMVEKEKAIIIIPSAYAYGVQGKSPIPPFTPLIFELQIYKVYPKSN